MKNICTVTMLSFRWLKIRWLSSLRSSFSVDRRYIAWNEAIQKVQWNEWFRWESKYEIEEKRRLGEVMHSRFMSQILSNNFWMKLFLLKVVFDRHYMPQHLRKLIQSFLGFQKLPV